MSITLPKESVIAANLSLGEMESDKASLKESASPYLGYTGVAGSIICFSLGFDDPVGSFFVAPPPHPNHPLFVKANKNVMVKKMRNSNILQTLF